MMHLFRYVKPPLERHWYNTENGIKTEKTNILMIENK